MYKFLFPRPVTPPIFMYLLRLRSMAMAFLFVWLTPRNNLYNFRYIYPLTQWLPNYFSTRHIIITLIVRRGKLRTHIVSTYPKISTPRRENNSVYIIFLTISNDISFCCDNKTISIVFGWIDTLYSIAYYCTKGRIEVYIIYLKTIAENRKTICAINFTRVAH